MIKRHKASKHILALLIKSLFDWKKYTHFQAIKSHNPKTLNIKHKSRSILKAIQSVFEK